MRVFITSTMSLFLSCFVNYLGMVDSYSEVKYLLKTNALDYYENLEIDDLVQGNCPSQLGNINTPDSQTTRNDEKCQALGDCHIAFTQVGEWVSYEFDHTSDHISYFDSDGMPIIFVNITLRVAAPGPRIIELELYHDGNELTDGTRLHISGGDYHKFEDVRWENVKLEPYNPHRLYVYFLAGNTNLCSVTVSTDAAARMIPFTINALQYNQYKEVDQHLSGNCVDGPPKNGDPRAPDAQTTIDSKCEEHGKCHIAFTNPGEWVQYNFAHSNDYVVNLKDGGREIFVDITVRVASLEKKKFYMAIEEGGYISGPAEFSFVAPGKGFQEYEDVTWRMIGLDPYEPIHSIQIGFTEGNINLCSITVEYSRQAPQITWTALDYFNSKENSPSTQFGGCNPRNDGVDIQPTSVSVAYV